MNLEMLEIKHQMIFNIQHQSNDVQHQTSNDSIPYAMPEHTDVTQRITLFFANAIQTKAAKARMVVSRGQMGRATCAEMLDMKII